MSDLFPPRPDGDTATGFVGWLRIPGGRWKAVTSGLSEPEAFSRLQEHARKHKHSELLVLVEGEKP